MKSPCSIAVLESALAGNLPATDEGALHRHLEECEECSAVLERMAGGPAWCQEAASLLTEDELDAAVPAHDDWSAVDFTVEHLEPSDDPSVLGRLGGYDVLEIIGHGGMGVVLKAFDRELKRCIAIKVLAPHLALSSLAKKRFAREAQAAAAVVHPHVLAIHQVQPSGRLPFLVMPLVAGESLAERLTAQGTLELKEILRIGMQAAAGLAAAHEQGLVHRDVKPANILLEKGVERAVLTDFGLACAADDVTLTRWGIIAGTPQYMSPEQARGEPLDGRSDLFSLGCVLYEMATGVSPFRTDSVMATMRRLVDDSPQALASLNPELPPWFIAIVDRLLEKDPSRRFASAKEVSELLEGCLAHVQQPANVPLPAGLPKPALRRGWRFSNIGIKGVLTMVGAWGFGLLGLFLLAGEPTDISGEWTGEDWGKVVLKQTVPAEYTGTYSEVSGKEAGAIELKWSRIERRYNGTWREGEDHFGKISVRLVGEEIRGAWSTDLKSKVNPATPELADLRWVRPDTRQSNEKKILDLQFGPVIERTLNDVKLGRDSLLILESGELLTPPEDVRDFVKAMEWAQTAGADVVACDDAGGRGLRIIDGLATYPASWDATPKEVTETINKNEQSLKDYKETIPGLQGPHETGFSNMWVAANETPTFFIKTRKGTLGTLQITGLNEEPRGVKIRYKLVNNAGSDQTQLKRQRFEPVEGKANDTNWTVIPPPSPFSKTDWVVMARMTIGGEARIELPDDKQPRCTIKLLKGNDDAIIVQVQDTAKTTTVVTIARDQSAEVTVDGAGYNIRYASEYVAPNDPDTSHFAQVFVRRVEERREAPAQSTETRLRVLDANGNSAADNQVIRGTEGYSAAKLPSCSETPSHRGVISVDKLAAGTHWLLVRGSPPTVLRIELPAAEEMIERRVPRRPSLVGKNLDVKVSVEVKDDVELIRIEIHNRTAETIKLTEADLELMTAIKGPGADAHVLSPMWSKVAAGEPIPKTTIDPNQTATLQLDWADWVKHGFWFSRDGEAIAEPTFPEREAGKTWVRVTLGSARPVSVIHPDKIVARGDDKQDSPTPNSPSTEPVLPSKTTSAEEPPATEAERAIARLVLVYFQDRWQHALPAVLVNAGSRTLVVTTGPAAVIPDGSPPAIDRAFLEFQGRSEVKAEYMQESTKELFVYSAERGLTTYRPDDQVVLAVGDVLSAMLPGSSSELVITPNAARVAALDRQADFELPKPLAKIHHFDKLVEVDHVLPEGTPLFKDGKLAGLTLLGSRFLGEAANKSYVIPVDRIAALCSRLESADDTPERPSTDVSQPKPTSATQKQEP